MNWINAQEQQPKFTGEAGGDEYSPIVLAHWPNGWIGLAQFWVDGWHWVEQDAGYPADADPTHWMPLPEKP